MQITAVARELANPQGFTASWSSRRLFRPLPRLAADSFDEFNTRL